MAVVNNHDVAGLTRRINRFIDELQKSTSSEASQVSTFDVTRAETYLTAIRTYHDWVMAQPQLDLPETHPRAITLEDNPSLVSLENESLTDLVYLFSLCRDECVNSQSARNGSGLIGFDSIRLMSVVAKAENFLKTYIAEVTPLDLPESSPMRQGATQGRTGT